MTFPVDPGLRAYLAKEAEHVLLPDEQAPPVPPESFQAEDAEHVLVTASGPADAEAPPAS
jgi:hypothetical protein